MTLQSRGEETRTRILDAALEAFARYGYDASGVAEICRRAEVTKGGFYHHFPSKQAVFLELLERWLGEVDTQLQAAAVGAESIPDELMRMTRMIRQVFLVADGKLPLFLEFLTKAGRSPVIWQATVAPIRRYQAFFSGMFEKGVSEGSLASIDTQSAALILMSFAIGLLALGLLDPHGADWGQVAQDGVMMLLKGVERKV